MKSLQRVLSSGIFILSLSSISLAHPLGQSAESELLRISVHVYNYAGVPDAQVRAAEAVATQVLHGAGIELQWNDCSMKLGRAESNSPACDGTSNKLLLYFVGPLEGDFKWVANNALGFSIVPVTHEQATMAYVSWPRIQKLSASTSTDAADLLGLATAHEVGHLLFGSHDHANQGIMRAPWKSKDLQSKHWEEFRFTRGQAQRLRSAVKERPRTDSSRIGP